MLNPQDFQLFERVEQAFLTGTLREGAGEEDVTELAIKLDMPDIEFNDPEQVSDLISMARRRLRGGELSTLLV